MGEQNKTISCQIACWAMGAGAGFLAFIMLMVLGDWGFLQAVFGAAVIFIVIGALLAVILCRPLPALGEVQAGMAEIAEPEAPKPDATPVAKPAAAAAATSVVSTAEVKATGAPMASGVKSGTLLDGEKELATRKGEWSYKAEESAAKPKPKAAPEAAPKAQPATPSAAASGGEKPDTLAAARGGKADDLKQIKGVGPKLEKMLHGMGFYHFDQIAGWSDAQIAWVDDNLTGFKGRASRDAWVDQARVLASGGETAFSKRVDEGDVY
jgi:predicted flap endonuclease-1-like 5' DNA nuclease